MANEEKIEALIKEVDELSKELTEEDLARVSGGEGPTGGIGPTGAIGGTSPPDPFGPTGATGRDGATGAL
jgi:bacteriocin-like protein